MISLGLSWCFVELIPNYCENSYNTIFKFNFLFRVYPLEGVSLAVLEILMKGDISDSKDLPSVQRLVFLSPDFAACSFRLRAALLGSFACSGVFPASWTDGCPSLSLGIAVSSCPRSRSAADPAAMAVPGLCPWSRQPKKEHEAACLCRPCRVPINRSHQQFTFLNPRLGFIFRICHSAQAKPFPFLVVFLKAA